MLRDENRIYILFFFHFLTLPKQVKRVINSSLLILINFSLGAVLYTVPIFLYNLLQQYCMFVFCLKNLIGFSWKSRKVWTEIFGKSWHFLSKFGEVLTENLGKSWHFPENFGMSVGKSSESPEKLVGRESKS